MADPPCRELHLKWVRLRRQGLTFEEIGKRQDPPVTRQCVHQAVRKILREETRGAARDLIEMESQRLDYLQRKVWNKATQPHNEEHLPALDRVLRIMERRASLLGLDGKDLGPEDDGTAKDVPIEELRELLAGLGFGLVKLNDEKESE
jgi:hypothetical protein